MQAIVPVVSLLVGLGLGAAVAYGALRARLAEALRRGRADGEAERVALVERLAARQQSLDETAARAATLEEELRQARERESRLRAREAELATALDQQAKQHEEKLAVLDEARQKLSDAFKALAAEALRSNNQSFLELAKTAMAAAQEAARSDLEKRQQAIGELVKPVRDSLEKVDQKILELEKAREGAYQGLRQQVQSLLEDQQRLRLETSNLVKALRAPQARGRWGEIQLRRVVEMAGMIAHCDFFEQQSTDTEQGRLRPDLLVRLPGNKNIVIDAKTPLKAYLDAIEATDDQTRLERLRDHARQVRNHVAALSRKSYFEQFDPAPEFVVLFLPGEVFFSAALEHDPSLIEAGVEQNVIIATPTTLIALLRAVAYGWRQEQLAQNARQISELGRELHRRLSGLGSYLAKLGKSLSAAVDAYNRAVGALEARVLPGARRFKELGAAGPNDEIELLGPVETTTRALRAVEFDVPPERLEGPEEPPPGDDDGSPN